MDVLYDGFIKKKLVRKKVPKILIAPSWGKSNLLETLGIKLAISLSSKGYQVVIRPHQMLCNFNTKLYKDLLFLEKKDILRNSTIEVEDLNQVKILTRYKVKNILLDNLLISDYSGISLEFAALTKKSVISVDVEKKVKNDEWEKHNILPIEISIRDKIGILVKPDIEAILISVEKALNANKYTDPEIIDEFLINRNSKCNLVASQKIIELLNRR